MTLIVACGLRREAAIIGGAGRDIVVIAGGGDAALLERALDDAAARSPGVMLSAGLAGALDSGLRPGDLVIDGEVVETLRGVLPTAVIGAVAGSDAIVATAEAKRVLAARTGAIAVDMESHITARVARERGLPFGVVRAISDAADEDLPPAALVGMRPDGGVALGAVLLSLARQPNQLPALLRTGRHAGLAFRNLGRAFDAIAAAGFDRTQLITCPPARVR
ncbi:phosphorylase [Sphingomonas sp.]|uniref:phosphorylase family protein n=1 Tax=Sphingomonas sp. TaxID=28214 RepID=UPI002CCE858D|nr:phosphorylase [Sphingomonas sp.]HWK34914.1 phosphorylase [Sphingomonas sp.]